MDGYVGLFLVPDVGTSIPVISSIGTATVTEVLNRSMGAIASSDAEIAITGVQMADATSGSIMTISIESMKEAVPAINIITFVGDAANSWNMADGDTVTISNGTTPQVYTFKPSVTTTANQVKIGTTLAQTVGNFIKAVNLTGVSGTDYGSSTTKNAHALAFYSSGNTVTIRAQVGGTGPNGVYLLSTSSSGRAIVKNATFWGGVAAEEYKLRGTFPVFNTDGSAGWRGTTNNNGTFRISGLSTVPTGMPYKFRIKYFNSDGQQAVNGSGVAQALVAPASVDYTVIGANFTANYGWFDGREDLAEYAEVIGLRCVNASVPEGNASAPGILPYGGVARLEWDDMKQLSTGLTAHKLADNTTSTITESQLAQIAEYVVYMYVATGSSAPVAPYPNPSEANGTWYVVARTKDNYAEIQCPINKRIAFWVGFGTSATAATTTSPLSKKLSYAQY